MHGKLRVLILDDDPAITELLADLLASDCAVTIANQIDAAMAALDIDGTDLLLCDYRLDGAPSTGFLEAVALRYPTVRRVLMTGSPSREWQPILDRGLVVAALIKPFGLNQLWALLRPNE